MLRRGRRLEPEALKSGPCAARGPGRSPRRTKALALRGERPSRRPRPKLLQIRAGPFGRPPKRHPRGRNTRWCEKHENLVKNHGFLRKNEATKHPQHPIKPSRARIIDSSFSHGARARPKPCFSRFGGGTGSPKPGEHHEHQQPWPADPRQEKTLKNAEITVNTVFL